MNEREPEIIEKFTANDPSLIELAYLINDENVEGFTQALMGNTAIRKLRLQCDVVSNETLDILSDALEFNKGVRELRLSWGFDTVGIKRVSRGIIYNPTLTRLIIDFRRIDEEYATCLAKIVRENKNLTDLYLNHVKPALPILYFYLDPVKLAEKTVMPIKERGIEILADELKHHTTLTQFCLINNPLSRVSAAYIADVIKKNTTLELLNLQCCDLSDDAVKLIAEALKVNDNMKFLFLPGNKIGDDGVGYIADALIKNKKLVVLKLSSNKITACGAEKISVALEVNSSLSGLMLSRNELKEEGLLFIVKGLMNNKKFRFLDVSSVNGGSGGAELIGLLLTLSDSLESVFFANNYIGKEGMEFIAEGLEDNQHLRFLNLSESYFPIEGVEALGRALKKNKALHTLYFNQEKKWLPEQLLCLKDGLARNVTLMHIEGLSSAIPPREVKEIEGFLNRNKLNRMKNMALLFKVYSCSEENKSPLRLLGKDALMMILAMAYPELTPSTFQRLRHSQFFTPSQLERKESAVQVMVPPKRGCSIM